MGNKKIDYANEPLFGLFSTRLQLLLTISTSGCVCTPPVSGDLFDFMVMMVVDSQLRLTSAAMAFEVEENLIEACRG